MSNPFVAEIRIVGFNFAPTGWAYCNGQLLPISQNTALFSLLGTTYGGNGSSTFALPNLAGASPLGFGQGPGLSLRDLGESGGSATVSLTEAQIPCHNHSLNGISAAASSGTPTSSMALASASTNLYHDATNTVTMAGMAPTGSGQGHNNRQPYLALNFVIALQGVFPARS